ncbi:MAG TPA: ATP-binding protein, partial [Microthrixaceae bacterium]|nr:ATP-binding protein [Microthrixaceae bacterium]
CFGGLAVLLGQSADYSALRDAGLALLVATAGAALVIGPSAVRFVQSFSLERDDRVRAEERARVAAHLHDSVLQTLTLIQKKADDPAATASLARHQERSLRRWLYGTGGAYATADGDSRTIGWRTAMEEMVGAVEDHYATAIELVMVGDGEIFNGGPANDPSSPNGRGRSADESARATAVIAAAREALINASKFSGETHLSIYCELGDDRFDVFVRDRGKGFDLATVDPDRRGVRDSIVTRLAAVGGHATIRTAPGEGTEVALSVPIRVQPTNGRSPAEAPPAGTTPAGTTTRAIEGVSDR